MTQSKLSLPFRLASLFIGLTALISTIVLIIVVAQSPDVSWPQSIWFALGYFTIFTNIAVGLFMTHAGIKGRWLSFSLLTALALWITVVGVVYHLTLAAQHNPEGLLAITNIAHHTIVPIGTVAIWLLAKPRAFIPFRAPLIWIAFPLRYGFYSLARSTFINGS